MEQIRRDSLKALGSSFLKASFLFQKPVWTHLGNVETGFCLHKVTQESHRDPKSRWKPGADGDADVNRSLTSCPEKFCLFLKQQDNHTLH